MNSDIKIFQNKHILAKTIKHELIEALKSQTSPTQAYDIALAGGSTPRTVYEQWATINDDLLWSQVHLFWGDERCVPPDHDESNYKMAYEPFLSKIEISDNQIHRIRGEADPEMEAKRYENEIRDHLSTINGLPRFDWILLGIGTDGHTASLFPNAENKKNLPEVNVCVVTQHPQTGQQRISLTLPVINNARRITFLVAGEEKASIVREVLKIKSLEYPAAQVEPKSGILQWYLDEAAAELL